MMRRFSLFSSGPLTASPTPLEQAIPSPPPPPSVGPPAEPRPILEQGSTTPPNPSSPRPTSPRPLTLSPPFSLRSWTRWRRDGSNTERPTPDRDGVDPSRARGADLFGPSPRDTPVVMGRGSVVDLRAFGVEQSYSRDNDQGGRLDHDRLEQLDATRTREEERREPNVSKGREKDSTWVGSTTTMSEADRRKRANRDSPIGLFEDRGSGSAHANGEPPHFASTDAALGQNWPGTMYDAPFPRLDTEHVEASQRSIDPRVSPTVDRNTPSPVQRRPTASHSLPRLDTSPSPPVQSPRRHLSTSPTMSPKEGRSPRDPRYFDSFPPLSPTPMRSPESARTSSPLPFPEHYDPMPLSLPRGVDPLDPLDLRSLTPMPDAASSTFAYDKPRPLLYRTLGTDYLPSRSMNRLRGVDEELTDEDKAWAERSRKVKDDGRGRDWWGHAVGHNGDWGKTILSPIFNETEPSQSAASRVSSPRSAHSYRAPPRQVQRSSPEQPSALVTSSATYERFPLAQASKKEPVSGLVPSSLSRTSSNGTRRQRSKLDARSGPTSPGPSREKDHGRSAMSDERERRDAEMRDWARRTVEAYQAQRDARAGGSSDFLRGRLSGEDGQDRRGDWHEGYGGPGLSPEANLEVPVRDQPVVSIHDFASTPFASTPLFERVTSPRDGTTSPPTSHSRYSNSSEPRETTHIFPEIPNSNESHAHRSTSRDPPCADSIRRPRSPSTSANARSRSQSLDGLRPRRPIGIPVPQPTEAERAERRRLRKFGLSREAGLDPTETKAGQRNAAWKEWSDFLDRKDQITKHFRAEPCLEDVPVYNALAKLYLETSNPAAQQTAEEVLEQSLQLDPDSPETNALMATTLESRDPAAAIRHYQIALANEPSNAQYHANLASALERFASPSSAVDAWDDMASTLAGTPNEPIALVRLGRLVLNRLGDRARARRALVDALEAVKRLRLTEPGMRYDGPWDKLEEVEGQALDLLDDLSSRRGTNENPPRLIDGQKRRRRAASLDGSSGRFKALRGWADSSLSVVEDGIGALRRSNPTNIPQRFRSHPQAIPHDGTHADPPTEFPAQIRTETSETIDRALEVINLIVSDRTAADVASETARLSRSIQSALAKIRASSRSELDLGRELVARLQGLEKDFEALPAKLVATAKLAASRPPGARPPPSQSDPLDAMRHKLVAAKRLSSMGLSEPYDPYIPGSNPNAPGGGPGPSGSAGTGAKDSRTAAIQQQIDDTVGIMRDNINKVAERGERLDALQDKTDTLAQSAQGFRKGANRVRKRMWWKDMKMRMLIAAGIAILVIIIVVPIVVKK
ncbi:hypothetical protein JCM10212_005190 [Sporobolomyces blumeae]